MVRKHKAWIGYAPTHKSFRPYVVAIGEAAVAWNGLHEAFRCLFTTIGNDDFPSSAAMWYSLRSDRAQRQLITALARNAYELGQMGAHIFDRIAWLMKQADKLAAVRNDAIHTPLISSRSDVQPDLRGGHANALNLLNKDLLSEYRWCRDMGVTLTDFCIRLDLAIAYL